MDKYKALKNQSLHILDNESIIQEEIGMDEGVKKNLVYQKQPAQEKAHLRDLDIGVIHSAFSSGDQYAVIEYLRTYKVTDLLFIRGSPNVFHTVVTYNEQLQEFSQAKVPGSQLNILQLAILGDHADLVKYILVEHKTFSNTKQPKNIDPRIILFNQVQEDDELFTVRLSIEVNSHEIFQLLWNTYPKIYNERHLL